MQLHGRARHATLQNSTPTTSSIGQRRRRCGACYLVETGRSHPRINPRGRIRPRRQGQWAPGGAADPHWFGVCKGAQHQRPQADAPRAKLDEWIPAIASVFVENITFSTLSGVRQNSAEGLSIAARILLKGYPGQDLAFVDFLQTAIQRVLRGLEVENDAVVAEAFLDVVNHLLTLAPSTLAGLAEMTHEASEAYAKWSEEFGGSGSDDEDEDSFGDDDASDEDDDELAAKRARQ